MKVLYLINAGIMGGRERHVLTLVKSLPKDIDYCICAVSAGEAVEAMKSEGLNVVVLGGRNGHDMRVLVRFIRLMREFKPDVVHAHSSAFLPYVAMRLFSNVVFVQSVHGPSISGAECQARRKSFIWKIKAMISRLFERKPDYFLPVSKSTWDEFKVVNPNVKGEVFFNALRLDLLPAAEMCSDSLRNKVVGMVGRNASQKDWPLFCQVAKTVSECCQNVEFWGVGADEVWALKNCGINAKYVKWFGSRQDARDLIAKMDVFLMTSKHEQLPTTLLESFAIGVPVVGVMPEGGTSEVTALSCKTSAMLRAERNAVLIAEDLIKVLNDFTLRESMIVAGKEIVTENFDMKKLCSKQLITIYSRLIKERA